MANEVQIFENKEFGKVRTVVVDGEPWFVGKDVAKALGYKDTKNALKAHVDTEDKMGWRITTPSRGKQGVTVINESGVYSLVFSSKLPAAKRFKRWVTSEVLPALRKNGTYTVEVSDDIKVAQGLLAAKRMLDEANEKIKVLQPKADFYDTVASSESLLSMGDVAKTLDMGIGRNKLFAFLRDKGILNDYNVPYQRYVNAGYFKLVENHYNVNGNDVVSTTTYVKQRGVDYIRKLLNERGLVCG